MDKTILEAISAEAMEQHELIRQNGFINMFNRTGVMLAADALGFSDLIIVAADRKLYTTLLSNFDALMTHYEISQELRD